MGLKVKLVKSFSGASAQQLATITGLGLSKFGQERLLKDSPAIRGMVFKVKHLVRSEIVSENPTPRVRRKRPRAAASQKE
jgi:large subunit ribosomal protein L30